MTTPSYGFTLKLKTCKMLTNHQLGDTQQSRVRETMAHKYEIQV